MMHVPVIYPLTWAALWLLVRVAKDYRQAVYGRSSREIDPEHPIVLRLWARMGD